MGSLYNICALCFALQHMCVMTPTGWLRLVGSIKLHVSFAKGPCKRDHILQKRTIDLSILLTVATPYMLSRATVCAVIMCEIEIHGLNSRMHQLTNSTVAFQFRRAMTHSHWGYDAFLVCVMTHPHAIHVCVMTHRVHQLTNSTVAFQFRRAMTHSHLGYDAFPMCVMTHPHAIHVCVMTHRVHQLTNSTVALHIPSKKLFGCGVSTPYPVFCLICTMNSELKSFFDLYY